MMSQKHVREHVVRTFFMPPHRRRSLLFDIPRAGQKTQGPLARTSRINVWTIPCHLFIVINLIRNECVYVQGHKFMSLCNTSYE